MNRIATAAAALIIALAATTPAAAKPAAAKPVAAKSVAPAATPAASTLAVHFTGIATPTGAVLLSVFSSEAAFDTGGKPVASAMARVTGTTADTSFPGLAPGRYAIKAFHDVDGDGKMATTLFGMPTEPYAFSNDAVGNAGPANWAAASFDVGAKALTHAITIK